MTDYITLIINKEVLTNFYYVILLFMLVWVICQMIDMVKDTIKRNKRREVELKARPYKKHYEELLSKEKYKEALAYAQTHDVHLANSYYYW